MDEENKLEYDLNPGTYHKFKIGNSSVVVECGELQGRILITVTDTHGNKENESIILQKSSPDFFEQQAEELRSRIESKDYENYRGTTNKAIAGLVDGYNGDAPLSDKSFIKSLQNKLAIYPDPFAAFLTYAKNRISDTNNPIHNENSRSTYTIGRATNNQLILADEVASRNHAQIIFQSDKHGGKLIIKDLGSRNGTRRQEFGQLQNEGKVEVHEEDSVAFNPALHGGQPMILPEQPADFLRRKTFDGVPPVDMKPGQTAIFSLGNIEDVVSSIHVSCDEKGEIHLSRFSKEGNLTNSVRVNMDAPKEEIGGGGANKAVQQRRGYE